MQEAGASKISELYTIYVTLAKLGVSSEHIYYKIAVFIDKHIYQPRKVGIVCSL